MSNISADHPVMIEHLFGPLDGAHSVFEGNLPERQLRGIPRTMQTEDEDIEGDMVEIVAPTWYALVIRSNKTGQMLHPSMHEVAHNSGEQWTLFYVSEDVVSQ